MTKKIISALATLSLMGSYAVMAEDNGKVEISFRVGDSVLTVNGAPLEVTAPYIVGEGTTLVPVRVITEAFGAEVNWDGSDQSVNLRYPDVDITIKIGSKSAVVNTHTEELAEAPQLYMDTTMVPLRFISETFGATVTWDNGLITVTKEAMEVGTTVEGVTDMEYIGDSYYGWSIKNPKKLQMAERDFGGLFTEFTDEAEKNNIAIFVEDYDENIDVDTEFNELKSLMDGMTLTAADKETLGNGVTKLHFGGKDKEKVSKIIAYISGKRACAVYTVVDVESDMKDELLAIVDTFMINSTREMYDLSNIVGGYREFSDDEYKIKLKLPASWASNDDDSNEFYFYDTESDSSSVSIGIYSKSETVTAASLAAADRASKVEVLNEDLSVISDVLKRKIGDLEAYYYTVDFNGDGMKHNRFLNDTFVEVGDYVYNIAVYEESPEAAAKIISSFEIEELDSQEVGIILRNSDIGGDHKIAIMDGKVTATNMWDSLDGTLNAASDARTGSLLSVIKVGTVDKMADFRDIVQESFNSMIKEEQYTSVKSIDSWLSDNGTIYSYTMKYTPDDAEDPTSYITRYALRVDGEMYVFTYSRYDIYYGGALDDEVKAMIESFEVE